MAFDQSTRNRLQRFVTETRTNLTEEFTRQLQSTYGMDPGSGMISSLESLPSLTNQERQTAQILRDTISHYLNSITGKTIIEKTKQALDRILREQAFTVLNRLCALKMAEARGFLIESISKDFGSKGFQLYKNLAGVSQGDTGDAYKQFLFSLFDEFSLDLSVLFDRHNPQGRLFPRETSLLQILEQINHSEIEHLWSEDETIGWIYQYFNSQQERKKMREESQAPRNSRELAVRNQFFTPRYVVEFLTDNTLGRIWYEMTQGRTELIEQCKYMVRRPTEIFLEKDAEVPDTEDTGADQTLNQEELFKQPVSIPYRAMKDPRIIRMLDPACGSMHFGLYSFDLFEMIYVEAWKWEEEQGEEIWEREPKLQSLHSTFSTFEEYQKNIPKLIIENNIHGVDIDPRAVQIAGLSLWLRAQRAWHEKGIKPDQRPIIQKSNIVCAEPMPGDKQLLKEFTENLSPPVLGKLVETIFDKMLLAGEAGILLKIEEEIVSAIEEAKKKFDIEVSQQKQDASYLPQFTPKRTFEVVHHNTTSDFWSTAEARILEALQEYAERAESEDGKKRLFAEDAARGFAFIDLCRKRFDVVLMNPPFGEYSSMIKKYIDEIYAESNSDIAYAFVQRSIQNLVESGFTGALTTRLGFYVTSAESWRENVLKYGNAIDICLDLGYGVLEAVVETAAYTISKDVLNKSSNFISLLEYPNKINIINDSLNLRTKDHYIIPKNLFKELPGFPFSYWSPSSLINSYRENCSIFENIIGNVMRGFATGDNERWLRNVWEVSIEQINKLNWIWYPNGGEYSPYYIEMHLLLNWKKSGKEILNFINYLNGKPKYRFNYAGNSNFIFKPGLTYSSRTTSGFAVRILPNNCICDQSANPIFFDDISYAKSFIFYFMSKYSQAFIELTLGSGELAARNYTNGLIGRIPINKGFFNIYKTVEEKGQSIIDFARLNTKNDETSPEFYLPPLFVLQNWNGGLNDQIISYENYRTSHIEEILQISFEIESLIEAEMNLDRETIDFLNTFIGPHPIYFERKNFSLPIPSRLLTKKCFWIDREFENRLFSEKKPRKEWIEKFIEQRISDNLVVHTKTIISYIFGILFGRWDIRFLKSKSINFAHSEDFESIFPSPPSMLTDYTEYPIEIPINGVIVNDENFNFLFSNVNKYIWGSNYENIEQEILMNLGEKGYNNYFSKPTAFFNDHLLMYSKSRRSAPIYWPLQTPSLSYTLWIYYHRLTDQTLYTCVNDFVEPKLKSISEDLNSYRSNTNRSSAEERKYTELNEFESELKNFREELLHIAKFWKPNLNDGVQITAAPLWKLFQHREWQKKLKETWESLEQGEYDWAHLAYSIWTERVLLKCHTDRSFAIAHDVEEDFWEEKEVPVKKGRGNSSGTKTEWKPKELNEAKLNELIRKIINERNKKS